MTGVTLEDAAKSWARYLRAEKRRPRTIRNYMDTARYFREWCEEHGRPTTLDALTRDVVVDYLADIGDTRSPGTALTRHRQLSAFCNFLVAEGDLAASPMAGLSAPTVPDDPVPVLEDADLAALLKTAGAHRNKHVARRDEAMLRVLIDAGPRISELAGMLLEECDLDHGAAWVSGKGGHRRLIFFGPRTGRALDRYIRVRREHRLARLPNLWLTERGGISKDGVGERLKVISQLAGVEGVHAHRFRHTWAHDYLDAGGGEQNLKHLAGWRSDAMLARYGASQIAARARREHGRLSRGDRV